MFLALLEKMKIIFKNPNSIFSEKQFCVTLPYQRTNITETEKARKNETTFSYCFIFVEL